MIRTIITDDEPAARNNLEMILQQHCTSEIRVVGQAGSVKEAFTKIKMLQPDLVFLDIEMGIQTGFDLVTLFDNADFQVVFVTAFDQYAIRAIKICALDYLLKPLSITEVKEAVNKAMIIHQRGYTGNWKNLLSVINKKADTASQVAVPVQGGYKMITIKDIVFLKAENEYTNIYCTDTSVLCSSTNLGYYEELLSDYPFYRVHHSYIVSRMHIKEYSITGEVQMNSGNYIPVSRRRKTAFLQWLKY